MLCHGSNKVPIMLRKCAYYPQNFPFVFTYTELGSLEPSVSALVELWRSSKLCKGSRDGK